MTVGLSPEDTPKASFYNPTSDMSWSSQSYAFEHIIMANEMKGRCDLTDKPCAHVMPEVWIGQEKKWKNYLTNGHIDQVNGDGQVGKISWYIPVYTARRHPEVASFHGMAGRREQLAEIFKRPTNWGDYCLEVSPTKCQEPDGVASRPPEVGEEDKYFSDPEFIGHFRPTDSNNCTANPDSCTGHIVGAPCSWSTNIDAQTYHNDIALESNGPLIENGGYSYSQMIQVWRAANATQSDLVMWWWTPDATIEEFRGTPFQFQQVLLPEPTSECREARILPEDRCSLDRAVRRGEPGGGCDNEANSLQKVVAASLRDMTYDTPEVDRSPGYQAILNLKVNHLDMNTMLAKWVSGGRSGYAAREAVCDWVVEHQEELESYIPRGYPRVFAEDASYSEPLLYAALGVAGVAIIYVLVVFVLVYIFSDTKVFVYAQVPFIYMVLFGLLLVACGSIFFALEPQNPICTCQVWLTTLGYTLELVPLLVKVAAINRLMAATRRMRRVKISMRSLFCTVASLVLLVVVFLSLWTALDPPERDEGRYLTEEDNFEIVTTITCSSDSGVWDLIVICWNGILIVCATVLAFQSRTIKQEFNDSQSLGTMIYSHFVFAVLRAVTFNLGGSNSANADEVGSYPTIDPATIAAAISFLLSMDVITAVSIYIIPKVEAARKAPQPHSPNSDVSEMASTRYYTKNPDGSHSAASKAHGGTAAGGSSRSNRSGSSGKAGARPRSGNSMPSINEASDEHDDDGSKDKEFSLKSGGNNSNHRRVTMDGQVHTDEEDEDDTTSSDEDYGGPRFARTSTPSVEAPTSETTGPSRSHFGFRNNKSSAEPTNQAVTPPGSSMMAMSKIDPIEEGSESFSGRPFESSLAEEPKATEDDAPSDTPTDSSPDSST